MREITGREVRQWKPSLEGGKDLADYNAHQIGEVEEEEQDWQEEEER